jgi:hypothetical protein
MILGCPDDFLMSEATFFFRGIGATVSWGENAISIGR